MRSFGLAALMCSAIFAQTPAPVSGSISGVIRDPAGKPLPKIVLVLTGAPSGRKGTRTGDQGEFSFTDLPPALYRLTAQGASEVLGTKAIPLDTSQSAIVNMVVEPSGGISGRVLDENRRPVAGMAVALLASVYRAGEQAYEAQYAATSDKEGKYRLPGVKPGLSYRLLAMRSRLNLEVDPKAPVDRDAREPGLPQTYFPNSSTAEGAGPVVLFAGEEREGVDIRIAHLIPRCIEATLLTPAGPGAMDFEFLDSRGTQLAAGRTQADGRLRHCLAERTELRIVARAGTLAGAAVISAGDKDVSDFRVVLQPPLALRGIVELEGDAPAPEGGTVSVGLTLNANDMVKSSIPGQFSLTAGADDATLSTILSGVPKGFYVKSITCAGVPVIGNRLRLAGTTGAPELRIAIARDGGTLSALVQDAEGKAVPDAWVVAWPAGAASESEMSIRLWAGVTNGSGAYVDAIRPGKYLAVATTTFLTLNTETIARYWRARGKAAEVEIGAGASVNVTLPLLP